MNDVNLDRRIQRTRQILQSALIELMREKAYDLISVQDITERANVGRSTFYRHFQSKDELMLAHHADFSAQLNLNRFTREEFLAGQAQDAMKNFLEQLSQAKTLYQTIADSKEAGFIMRGIRQQMATNLLHSLKMAFPREESKTSLELMVTYLVGAQLSMIDWWLKQKKPASVEEIANSLHQFQRAVICDNYGIRL